MITRCFELKEMGFSFELKKVASRNNCKCVWSLSFNLLYYKNKRN
uniref:Uncharacterized protein n=1 Tax=Nelumbo nucifera TaxID=4432 RepID=A0A822ZSG8_NELNU|nr:TPA_asm: hypothetical protein HUJ06_004511 [Nelumbo nucifera]DAD46289.1 TPA_asm: hypothetical protein HUJ06_004519 [Nelumbo nucifera]DAD46298.1 TPA_asm: hypothetical protein HUJ06_004528 [Nelumbo nucifera]